MQKNRLTYATFDNWGHMSFEVTTIFISPGLYSNNTYTHLKTAKWEDAQEHAFWFLYSCLRGGKQQKTNGTQGGQEKVTEPVTRKKYPKLFCLILIKFQGKQLVFKPHQSGNASFQLCTLQI